MAVMDINVFSVMLRHGMDVTVVLPDDIDDEEQLKCVWLYHGGSGDNTEWLYHTALVDTVEKRHFAAVLPNVDESCFVNMNIGNRYESYVAKELPSIIWNMFKCISDKREDNYVSGYSMVDMAVFIQFLSTHRFFQRWERFRQVIRLIQHM